MDKNKIYIGDALKLIQSVDDESIDLIIADPPYGIGYQSSWKVKDEQHPKIENDEKPFTDWLPEAYRVLKKTGSLICFCRWDVENTFSDAIRASGFDLKSQVIWDRVDPGMGDLKAQFAPRHDNLLFATKGEFEFKNGRPNSVLKFMCANHTQLIHPNQKPLELIRHLINKLSQKGDTVLDPFTGSGTTCVACKQLGRNFIAFEIEEMYVALANKRVNEVIRQIVL